MNLMQFEFQGNKKVERTVGSSRVLNLPLCQNIIIIFLFHHFESYIFAQP
jgi:hypothetical protein